MSPYKLYLLERGATYVVVIVIALAINFTIPRLIPGDPISSIIERTSMVGGMAGPQGEGIVKEWREMFGYDKDVMTQFLSYLGQLFRGNLGYSIIAFPATVSEIVVRSIPWTIGLLTITTLTSWLLGTVIGAVVGWKGGRIAKTLGPVAMLLSITPYYFLAMIFVFIFAYTMHVLPSSGGYSIGTVPSLSLESILDIISHAILPSMSIVLSSLGWWFLSMRSMMVGLKEEDYVLMAEAKGLTRGRILWKYAFRNCLLPQVTGLALSLGRVFGGSLIMEVVFNYPGLGYLLYSAITNLDYPVIQGIILLLVVSVCTAMLIIDVIVYPLVDPRIRRSG